MLGLGMVSAATDTASYRNLSVINKSSHTFNLDFGGSLNKILGYPDNKIKIETGKRVELKAQSGTSIPADTSFQLRLIGIPIKDMPVDIYGNRLSTMIQRSSQELRFNVNPNDPDNPNDPKVIKVNAITTVKGDSVEMTLNPIK